MAEKNVLGSDEASWKLLAAPPVLAPAATAISLAASPAALANGHSLTNKTTDSGIGGNQAIRVNANSGNIHAATTNDQSTS